jgi:uncharacterized protein YndB with AHSA1/START domain
MEKQLTKSRVFDAPVEEVWKMWTEPEYVMEWWGPDKFTCPLAVINFQVGGISLVSMQAPGEFGGQVFYSIWTYTSIVPLQSIAFVQNLADASGNKLTPTAAGMPADFPEEIRTEVTFTAISEHTTEMTVTEYADFGQTTYFATLGLEQSLQKAVVLFQIKKEQSQH